MPDKLAEYRDKRDFHSTPEPRGDAGSSSASRFVIQKHASSRLHYDLRLEIDGVLKSWAVPKGPSTDPREKRLAQPTEDHPIEYLEFEGVIPEGEYGGGTVMVWDIGHYQNRTFDDDGNTVPMDEAYSRGHISVVLDGEKLSGGYALTRTGSGDDERWLLVKKADDEADARRNPVSSLPGSALTGRSLDEIEEDQSG